MLQVDLESSLRAVVEKVEEVSPHEVHLQQGPLASHSSLGGVERWHAVVQGQFRVLKSQLEKESGIAILPEHRVCH